MTLFDELKLTVYSKYNSTFHIDCLDVINKVWFTELCGLIEKRFEERSDTFCPECLDGMTTGNFCKNCGRRLL